MPTNIEFSKIIKPDQDFIYTYSMPVRIGDVNYGNHLAATAVPLMLHQVRLKFLVSQGFSESDIDGVGLVVADLYVSYQCESFFDDELIFHFGIESIEKTSAMLVYKIENKTQDKRMGVAKERIVFFDLQKKRVVVVPDAFKRIQRHLVGYDNA